MASGIEHAWTSLAHWLLAVALCLLGGRVVAVRLATTFLAGQLLGVGIQTVLGLEVDPVLAEAGVVLSVVLLAVQALAPRGRPDGLELLTVAGGLAHGLGVSSLIGVPPSFSGLEWLYSGLAVLGMDGLLLLAVVSITAALSCLARFDWCPAFKRALTYGLGAVGVATALTLVLIVPVDELEADPGGVGLPSLSLTPTGSGAAASRALAPQGLQDPVQVFVTIDPFETRLETLVRLRDFARRIAAEPDGVLEPAAQPRVKSSVLD